MLLWIIFAAVTAALLAVILRPLASAAHPTEDIAALAVYRDQLSELDREEAAGLIAAAEAESARSEITRRLLKADDGRKASAAAAPRLTRQALIGSLVAFPALALILYLAQGSPGLSGLPYAERIAHAEANRDIDALILKVERHLAEHPSDAAGWRVLAPAYRAGGRYDAAARAFGQALAYGKPDADLLADFGEATVLAAQGIVTKDAADSFAAALRLDAKHVKARYFHALSLLQDGKREAALSEWRGMLSDAPADAPWRSFVESRIAAAGAPSLSDEQIASAERMTAAERKAMISVMVQGLADRLEKDGSDLDGWLRLARARAIMGEPAKAAEALNRAGEIFKDDRSAMARIEQARIALQSR
ncbi:MAG: c-type cytochrome biogenesis protein CcmI [Aestuariivirgaceae bacterium]